MPFILALDEGTTSARACLYDPAGRRLAMASRPVESRFPNPGWVEQDPEEIWRAQVDSAREVMAGQGIDASAVHAIGITNQRETTIVWDRATGQPVAPAIVWQCRRTADLCARLTAAGHAETVARRTGLVIDAYFSGTKIAWILDNVPGARERAEAGDLLFGNVDTWLVWKLTGGAVHVTDVSNASRTLLMNLDTGAWDADMLSLLGIPASMLPRIADSAEVVGAATAGLLPGRAEVPIAGIAGDQQAALFGQACFRPGLSKNTYGTGCFALLHTGADRPVSKNRLLETRAASTGDGPRFAVEGSVFVAGAAVQWLRDQLGIIKTAAESEAIAAGVPDTGGAYMVPAFTGLGAPHWDMNARGSITGLTRASSSAHIVRAALESIAYQTRELVEAMEADAGQPLRELRVDGGAASNDFLMQFQADILDRPLVRPADTETTALGAAYLAGLATGYWKSLEEVESFWQADRTFEPAMNASRRDTLWSGWNDAVRRTRSAT